MPRKRPDFDWRLDYAELGPADKPGEWRVEEIAQAIDRRVAAFYERLTDEDRQLLAARHIDIHGDLREPAPEPEPDIWNPAWGYVDST